MREVRQNQGDVPSARDHGVVAIRAALPRAARVDVNIGNNRQSTCFANRPQFGEIVPVKMNDAAVEAVWIEVVVKDEVDGARSTIFSTPEEKCAALSAASATALTQFVT